MTIQAFVCSPGRALRLYGFNCDQCRMLWTWLVHFSGLGGRRRACGLHRDPALFRSRASSNSTVDSVPRFLPRSRRAQRERDLCVRSDSHRISSSAFPTRWLAACRPTRMLMLLAPTVGTFLPFRLPGTKQNVALYTSEVCVQHDPGPQHPESPARLQRLRQRLLRKFNN